MHRAFSVISGGNGVDVGRNPAHDDDGVYAEGDDPQEKELDQTEVGRKRNRGTTALLLILLRRIRLLCVLLLRILLPLPVLLLRILLLRILLLRILLLRILLLRILLLRILLLPAAGIAAADTAAVDRIGSDHNCFDPLLLFPFEYKVFANSNQLLIIIHCGILLGTRQSDRVVEA